MKPIRYRHLSMHGNRTYGVDASDVEIKPGDKWPTEITIKEFGPEPFRKERIEPSCGDVLYVSYVQRPSKGEPRTLRIFND